MNKLNVLFLMIFAALFIASCAHHRDVRPGTDGINHVVVREPSKESAERSAISQANHYCEEYKKSPAFVEEKTQYTGTMDESTRDTVHKASQAAMVLGGAVGVGTHHQPTRTGGQVLGGAGTAGAIMTGGDDYTADMKFKCQ